MQNRIASLFELDELLSGKSNGHNGHNRNSGETGAQPLRTGKEATPTREWVCADRAELRHRQPHPL